MRAERGWSSSRQLKIFQGCYSGAVEASGGTHDLGGALDTEKLDDAGTIIARECGTTSWQRGDPEDPYFDDHNHWIWIGCPDLSWAAEDQVADYKNGRDGLAQNGPDKSPRPDKIQSWQDALADYEGEGIFGMTAPKKWDRSTDQTITQASSGDGGWKWLRISDDDDDPANAYSYLAGDVELWIATIGITVGGLPKGVVAQFKLVNCWDYSDDRPSEISASLPILEIIGTDGDAFGVYSFLNNLSDSGAPSGAKRKLRLVCAPPSEELCPGGIVIKNIQSRVVST